MLVGPELIRTINKQRVLRLIRSGGPVSRADAAEQTGMTRPTISAVVADLLEEGWIEEIGAGESSGGRPPILLRFSPLARLVLGAELGAGHVRAVLTDLAGNVLHRSKRRVETNDPKVELDRLCGVVQEVLAMRSPAQAKIPLAGLGLGLNGHVDTGLGLWRYSPHFQVADLNVVKHLTDCLGLEVIVENDARVMAVGERSFGCAKAVENLVYIRVGVSIGAGLMIEGKLYGGAHEGAGEIGHTVVFEEGPRCRCGNFGCLEAVANAVAISRRAVNRIQAGHTSVIPKLVDDDLSQVIGTTVIEAAHAGDRLARETLQEAGRFVGLAVGNVINLFDPDLVVIGGGTSRAGELLLEPVKAAAFSRALPGRRDKVQILRTALGEDSCPVGGAALVIESLFRAPTVG
ncbi:MAG TPA: ROK family transcriptional regulator [Symbiobacteriaceae bacterium]|nr:ROK family transcriptional regulator [Symbiobacteriaceae bacterium]